MSESLPVPPPTTKKARIVAKPTKSGPGAAELITNALAGCKCLSAVALKKILAAEGYEGKAFKRNILKMIQKKVVVQTKGTGASGSYRLAKPVAKNSNKDVVRKSAAKKPAAASKKTAIKKLVKPSTPKKAALAKNKAASAKKKAAPAKNKAAPAKKKAAPAKKKAAPAKKKSATPRKVVKAKAPKPARKTAAKKTAKK